jgi:2-oxoglutarate ferredoxin oxidoreductase subunit gamma
MSYHGLITSGFGGQGVMLFGQVLSYAAMKDSKFTTWLPSYGPEMRGGTANCTVVVSDEYIASPVLDRPNEVVVFNLPSLTKFEKEIAEGGVLIINSSVVERDPSRADLKVFKVPANDIAEKLGNVKIQNMVMLGAYLGVTNAVSLEAVEKALESKLSGKKSHLVELNMQAIKEGMNAVK